MKDINVLQHYIWVYTERRKKIADKFGVSHTGGFAPLRYGKAVGKINRKIKIWKKAIYRINNRKVAIIAIANHLACFCGVNVRGSAHKKTKEYNRIRGLFYKYCLENGISDTVVSEFVGAAQETAARGRRRFTQSFENQPENRELYNRFKTYINELPEN